MSTLWQVPVATADDKLLGMPRRLLREPFGFELRPPRDPRPSRSRRERVPAALRIWGPRPKPAPAVE